MKRFVGSGYFPVAWAAKYIIILLCFLSFYRHIVCVIRLRGLKKGERGHAHARVSARGSLEYISLILLIINTVRLVLQITMDHERP
jgi:hypothetical protein